MPEDESALEPSPETADPEKPRTLVLRSRGARWSDRDGARCPRRCTPEAPVPEDPKDPLTGMDVLSKTAPESARDLNRETRNVAP